MADASPLLGLDGVGLDGVVSRYETKSYRVKFPSGNGNHTLAGIIDRPVLDLAGAAFPVAVISHCFTCNKDFKATVRISRALASSGVGVLRFDMTGLGGSEGDFSQSNFSTNLADLAAAIRYADKELGPVGALIGHSFGGVASLITAAKAHESDDELPLFDLGCVATLAAPSDTLHLAKLLAKLAPSIETDGVGTVTIGGISWEVTRQMLDDFRSHNVADQLPEIHCPVLIMHSPSDQTVTYDHAIRLVSLVGQGRRNATAEIPPVSLLTLHGADHLLVKNPSDLEFVSGVLSAWCHRFAM